MQTPEKQRVNAEVIGLNQEFILLNHNRTVYRQNPDSPTLSSAFTEITLGTDNLPSFPLNISLIGGMGRRYSKGFILTPFNPEIGNNIVLQDLDPETRLNRLLENKTELEQRVDSPLASHLVAIQTGVTLDSRREMKAFGVDPDQYKFSFDPQFIEQLDKLRLLLSFPNGDYMARPNPNRLAVGNIDFGFFYPIDTGPLPTQGVKPKGLQFFVAEGFPLLVPFDKSRLETIKARILVE